MEQVVVELSPFTRRSRSLAVPHGGQDLPRGLEPGEHVVVLDAGTGDHFAAAVADVDFELTDTVYRLELGARITAAEAAAWLRPAAAPATVGVTTRDLVDLLGELRRTERELATAMSGLR